MHERNKTFPWNAEFLKARLVQQLRRLFNDIQLPAHGDTFRKKEKKDNVYQQNMFVAKSYKYITGSMDQVRDLFQKVNED